MPGWYVHMEAAAKTAERLRAANLPTDFPADRAEIERVGQICHRWRNYLEVGSLGPDLFYLLPDFAGEKGTVVRSVIKWTLDVWSVVDAEFVSKWDRWVGPIANNTSAIINQLSGGVLNMLGQALNNLAASVVTAMKGLLTSMGDWFGILTSGPPQGYGDAAFYWSDIFHYRRTYQFAFELYRQAKAALDSAGNDASRQQDAEARLAFAVGWLSHCATDVAGHPFTNAKCGGPFRDHWQRHKLVENHFDSQNYTAGHSGPLYAEYGTSALHFRIAFRAGRAGYYPGRTDAPAYDFTTGFPAYPMGHSPQETARRNAHFDLSSGPLPRHLCNALRDAMQATYGGALPKILAQDPRGFSAVDAMGVPDGRPNDAALDDMWTLVYGYLAMTAQDGLSPFAPTPPPVINDHSFPEPPGGDYGVNDDPSRGADVENPNFTLLDLLLALFTWAEYVVQVAAWIATVLPGLIADVATFPLRHVLYNAFIVPTWNLYLLSRRTLVMTGFLMPNREEIDPGLTTLGVKSGQADSFIADLDDPTGFALSTTPSVSEPSGRPHPQAQFGLDGGFPRNIVRDDVAAIGAPDLLGLLTLTNPLRYANDGGAATFKPSEWLKPWNYPIRTPGGQLVPREDAPVHVGPFVVGETGTTLLAANAGNAAAWKAFERAQTPDETAKACAAHLPKNSHMGGPVDYGTYLVVRFEAHLKAHPKSTESPVPDFNLDADRGYAWHTWDWDRHARGKPDPVTGKKPWECEPDMPVNPPPSGMPGSLTPIEVFGYAQPCTPPHFFHADRDNPSQTLDPARPPSKPLDSQWYDPTQSLRVHYLEPGVPVEPDPDGPDPCKGQPPGSPPGYPEGIKWPDPKELPPEPER